MSTANYQVPTPFNEPVNGFTAGSPEKKELKKTLSEIENKCEKNPSYHCRRRASSRTNTSDNLST